MLSVKPTDGLNEKCYCVHENESVRAKHNQIKVYKTSSYTAAGVDTFIQTGCMSGNKPVSESTHKMHINRNNHIKTNYQDSG